MKHTSAAPRRMRGLTLVELLVSLAIGLVLMLAIVSAYLGSSNAGAVAQAQARMNEDAQAALAVLTQHLRMAANNPKQPSYAPSTPRNPVFNGTSTWAIRGCEGKFSNITTAASIGALTCAGGGTPDSLAIAYEADQYNTVANGTAPTDCLGNALTAQSGSVSKWNTTTSSVSAATVNYYVADNRFYIDSSAGGPSLYCKGNGTSSTAQPLVENVEDMQITYGVAPSTATTTLTVAGYLDADDIVDAGTTGLSGLPDDQTRWSKVATVRVCVLVRSERPIAPTPESAVYFDCTGTRIDSPPDLRLRRAYSTTVVLRNRIAQ